MHNNDVAAAEEQFSLLLEMFDEALAEGRPPPEIPAGLPAELRARLDQARACLEQLQREVDAAPLTGELEAWLRDPDATAGPAPEGLRLGRFRILRELGRGGNGIVFLARDMRLSRYVALKIPLPEVLFTPQLRQRFLQEAEAAACLEHRNLVPVYDADEEGPVCYIVSAYCPGPTLSGWLREQTGSVPARTAAHLVAALADGVAYIHGKGMIHRDIKPSNVLLEPVEEVAVGVQGGVNDALKAVPRLTDFGLAKFLEGGGDRTKTGAPVGTVAYMPPEQAQGRKGVGPAADVYALGVILYELLTGRVPFQGESDPDTLRQILEAEAVPPRRLRPGVPRDLETICLKCLEKEPARRYADAAQLGDRLRLFLEGKPIPDRRPGWWERLLKWVRRRPAVAALSAVTGVALIALVVGSVWYGIQAEKHAAEVDQARKAKEAESKRAEEAVRQAADTALRHYPSSIQQAESLWRSGQLPSSRQELETQRPRPGGGADLREFAWRYLWAIAHPPSTTLPGPAESFYSLALSPDGRILAAGTFKGVWLWDTGTGQVRSGLLKHNHTVSCLAFSPDGKTLVAGASGPDPGAELKFWEVETGRQKAYFPGQPSIRALAFSPDGKTLGCAIHMTPSTGPPGTLRLYEHAGTWRRRDPPERASRPAAEVLGLAYSPAGQKLVLSGEAGQVWLCDASTLKPVQTGRLTTGGIYRVAYAPGGNQVAFGSASGEVVACRVSADGLGVPVKFHGVGSEVRSLAYTPDGKTLAAGREDGTIRLWDAATGNLQAILPGHRGDVRGLVFTPDGKGLLSAAEDGTIKRWDLRRVLLPRVLPGHRPYEAWSVAFSPDGKMLASAGDDGLVRLWDAATGEKRGELRGHTKLVTSVAFSPDGKTLASGSYDQMVRLWNLATREPKHILKGHRQQILRVAFSTDGKELVSTANTPIPKQPDPSSEVKLWDPESGREMAGLPKRPERGFRLAYSPDGRFLALGAGQDGKLVLRDPKTWKVLKTFDVSEVRSLAFSPDGNTLAIGTARGGVRLWDVSSGRERNVLNGHGGVIRGLAFTPDGRTLASASNDGTVKLWHMDTEQELLTIRAADKNLMAVAFNRDGRSMAVACHNGAVLLYWTDRDIVAAAAAPLLDPAAPNVPLPKFHAPAGKVP